MEKTGYYKDASDMFIELRIDEMKRVREEEFERNGYEAEEYKKREKVHIEKKIDVIDYMKRMRKQIMMNRNKSSNKDFKEVQTVYDEEIDILSDDLFKTKEETKEIIIKKVEEMERKEIEEKIQNYFEKRNIKLEGVEKGKLDKLLEDEKMEWKKVISLSKETGEISVFKILKKNEMGDYFINNKDDEKKLSKEEIKSLEKRKRLLNKFK
jgi:hypothetical protein